MLTPINLFAFMQQLPLVQAGQVLLVIGISFAVITLIASTARFHKMIQLTDDELATPEDCNDFCFVQATRYLSKINRISNGFGMIIVQFQTDQTNRRPVQDSLLAPLKHSVREECDKVCLFHDDCVALIIDTDEENAVTVAERICASLPKITQTIPAISAFRVGCSSFPSHGLNSQLIIDAATHAMESASFGDETPLRIAPPPESDESSEELEELGELSKKDKNSAIDPLTGVLKPDVIGSYMRKYLSEIRQKREPAAVLCVGINRIDTIINLHGEQAADTVISGVGAILQRFTRDSDLIGRYHRDDFLVLAPGSIDQGKLIAIRLREAVQKESFLFEGKRIKTSISAGISGHPEHGRTLRDLFRGSYTALQIVRGWNTSSCLIYDPEQHEKKGNI